MLGSRFHMVGAALVGTLLMASSSLAQFVPGTFDPNQVPGQFPGQFPGQLPGSQLPGTGLPGGLFPGQPGVDPQYSPPNYAPQRTYRLGVQVQNGDVGVALLRVDPNGAAGTAGLRDGDVIINVAGHQVGYVDGQLHDLGDEVSHHVDANGRVGMVVWRRATGQLARVIVDFSTAGVGGQALVRGSATYRATTPVTSGAMLVVRVRDVTYDHWTGVVVGETVVARADRVPVPFEVPCNPTQIARDHQYVIDAEIRDRGQLMYRTATSTPVAFTATGQAVANLLLTSTIGAAALPGQVTASDIARIQQWYRQYLGREATRDELRSWQTHLERGQPITDVQAYLLGSTEYYDRYRSNNGQYLNQVYREVYGTSPTQVQIQQWQQRLQAQGGVRSRMVQEMMRALGQ